MANLKEIRGTLVQTYSSDPANAVNGDIWYNSTSCTFKCFRTQFQIWTAGGAMGTARYWLGGAGTNTAALAIGGLTATNFCCASTESYNGSAWTAGGAMATARAGLNGAGTNTAALAMSGSAAAGQVACVESYNGSTWSAFSPMTFSRCGLGGAGTRTAALAFGGRSSTLGNVTCTEMFNFGKSFKNFQMK